MIVESSQSRITIIQSPRALFMLLEGIARLLLEMGVAKLANAACKNGGVQSGRRSKLETSRREFVSGAAALLVAGCGGEEKPAQSAAESSLLPESMTKSAAPRPVGPDVITVRRFYRPEHGKNLQPAFQAAIDEAQGRGKKVVNDLGPITAEMWAPARTSPFNPKWGSPGLLATDGTPLIVRDSVALDFQHATFVVKGPGGGAKEQLVQGWDQPWIGGWMYVIGSQSKDRLTFGELSIEDVTVDGLYTGSVTSYNDTNLSDKGFRLQATAIGSLRLRNVELRNFAAEVYYVAGEGPAYQQIDDCHFHGGGLSSFNPGGLGRVVATNLRAGRGVQACEIQTGVGHLYTDCEFYDSNFGANFIGGPKPSHGPYPYGYSYWDGMGDPPITELRNVQFNRVRQIKVPCWVRGKIISRDTFVYCEHAPGHLRDIQLEVESWCDRQDGAIGCIMPGPSNLTTQVPNAPKGTYYEPPSDIRLKLNCLRSANAVASGYRHYLGALIPGGLLDSRSITIELSGQAMFPYQVRSAVPGFQMPQIRTAGFSQIA